IPMALSSGATKIPRATELTSCSPNRISPASGFSRPATHLRSVVLPDPLSPRRTKNSFSSTCKSTASSARTESVPLLNVLTSEWISIITSLRCGSGYMLLSASVGPKGNDEGRHHCHHHHRDRGGISAPAAMPLSPDIRGKDLTFRRRQEHRHRELAIRRERSPNPSINQPWTNQWYDHFPKNTEC